MKAKENPLGKHGKRSSSSFLAKALALATLASTWGCGTLREKAPEDSAPPVKPAPLSEKSPEIPAAVFPPYPTPNAYETLLRAAADIQPASAPVQTMSRGAFIAYLTPRREALQLARAAFRHESRVVLETGSEFWQRHAEELTALERLADLFLADGLYAEKTMQIQSALSAYLETMRLGQYTANGGTLIDRLAGIAIEEKGAAALRGLLQKLSRENTGNALASLKKLEAERATPAAIREWEALLSQTLFAGAPLIPNEADREQAFAEITQHIRNMRILLLQMAGRKFRLLHSKTPESLSQLTPSLLDSIPLDPLSGKPFSRSALIKKP